jgi:hypothetical protein
MLLRRRRGESVGKLTAIMSEKYNINSPNKKRGYNVEFS